MTAVRGLTDSNDPLTARVRVPNNVVYRGFAHETVVLNLDTGLYHGLNPTGGRMLDTLVKVGSIGEAVDTLAEEYGVSPEEIRNDLWAFCESLVERGLIVIEPG